MSSVVLRDLEKFWILIEITILPIFQKFGFSGVSQKEREREKKKTKKGFHFSLRSAESGASVFFGVRSKVDPRNEGYAWIQKSWSFIKLHEVGNFPTWIIFNLKVI